jgi:hypothetical protein
MGKDRSRFPRINSESIAEVVECPRVNASANCLAGTEHSSVLEEHLAGFRKSRGDGRHWIEPTDSSTNTRRIYPALLRHRSRRFRTRRDRSDTSSGGGDVLDFPTGKHEIRHLNRLVSSASNCGRECLHCVSIFHPRPAYSHSVSYMCQGSARANIPVQPVYELCTSSRFSGPLRHSRPF